MITPYEKYDALARAIGLPNDLYLKREDLHPLGSHKGRSLPYMIDRYLEQGFRHFAISSSGNAALASGLYIKELNKKRDDNNKIILEILLGKNISKDKLEKIEKIKDQNILISIQDRPLQALFTKTEDKEIKGLRQSTDDNALMGYSSLAEEILEIPNIKTVFIGTSSGTTAQALAEYFIKSNKDIKINIVQTSSCHPIADAFGIDSIEKEISLAGAIVDQIAKRKDNLVKLISRVDGKGYVARNDTIKLAEKMLEDNAGIITTANGALSLAGLIESIYTGNTYDGSVVCIVGGL